MANSTNGQPARTPILIIYDNGSMDKADLPGGTLRNIGQQLIAMADNAVIAGNIPPNSTPNSMPNSTPEIAETESDE